MVRLLESVSAQAHKHKNGRVITNFQEKQTSYYDEMEVVHLLIYLLKDHLLLIHLFIYLTAFIYLFT